MPLNTHDVFTVLKFLSVTGLLTVVRTVEVRLSYGPLDNQGRVEVRGSDSELWGTVCDRKFGDNEAAVVCRQLGFKYSRNVKGVYKPRIPDYRLENLGCNGNEDDLADCIHGEWKKGTGQCNAKSDFYASVCCSNSPTFGEMNGDFFVSHCAENWLVAEETCEKNKSTLVDLGGYKPLLENMRSENGTGFWTKSFFTPWIWSNGCFQFKDDTFSQEEFNIVNNSVQICLQLCSLDSKPSSFVLSENFCRCLTSDSVMSSLTEVTPGRCNRHCSGETGFCGAGSGTFWSLYSIASEEIFYRISDPGLRDRKQCAVMVDNRRLATEGCYKRLGYICGQVLKEENYTMPRLLFFKHNSFYEVYMEEARQKCTRSDKTMRLIGDTILNQDGMYSEFGNLWVDISRKLADVYTIFWEPENRGSISLWRNLEPSWCLVLVKRDGAFIEEVTKCQSRFRFACYKNKGNQSSTTTDSSTDTMSPGAVTTIAATVVCSVVLVTVIVAIVFYVRRRSKRTNHPRETGLHIAERPSANIYNATYDTSVATAEHLYCEIKDPDGNIYHEAGELIEKPEEVRKTISEKMEESEAMLKEPLTIKKSYSSPKDMAELNDINAHDFQGCQDPNYIYPYDNAIGSEKKT